MMAKYRFLLLLALFASAVAQNDDELHIPVENDNQFPPDNHSESDGSIIEGSGAGVIDEPLETSTELSVPLLEDVQKLNVFTENIPTEENKEEYSCPKPCVCNIEGDTNKYIVDCSGYELTELPKNLDAKTTELNLQNNMLNEIPKEISALKELKILNVNNNEIKELVSGSISELPELKTLKLGNNRLIEYPQDLKNSFGLTKLEELDLGGNDMRTDLKPEIFSNFKSLRSLTLPSAAANLADDLCASLKESLEAVCIGSCNTKTFECPDATQGLEDGLLDFALPGLIALGSATDENVDPAVNAASDANEVVNETRKNLQAPTATNEVTTEVATTPQTNDTANPVGSISFHSAIVKAPEEEPKQIKSDPPANKSEPTSKLETEVVGATTSGTKTGGVDKSLIGIIVAGMVLVVAGITIKKNWSSIRSRFSSTPRNANERTGINTNGTTPEEVPLQEKSPV